MTSVLKRHAVLAIAAGAVLLRLLHLWLVSDGLFFDAPVIDARLNVTDARYLVDHSWAGPEQSFWKPPLYAYLLGLQFQLGAELTLPRIVQALLGAGSCVLVFAIGRDLFSRRIGIAGAAVTALCGPLIYFSGQLVSASLAVFLDLAAIYAVVRAYRAAALSWRRWLGCGALLGLAALVRPEILLVTTLVAALIWLGRDESRRSRAIAVAALVGGTLLAVAPVTLRNATRGGDAVLISANGGINLYIGTAPAYRGMVGLRPGTEWERLVREPEGDGIVRVGSAHSSYFARKALRVIADDPLGYAGHVVKKVGLFWHGYEIMSNFDLYDERGDSVVLAVLLWDIPGLYFPFGLLAPLALVGMGIALRRRHPSRVLIGFVGTLVAIAMLFFVTARFRLPAIPILALFAAYAAAEVARDLRAGRRTTAGIAIACAIVLAAGVNSGAFAADRAVYRREVAAEKHHYRGTVLFDQYGRNDEAVTELRKAVGLNPLRASTQYNLGLTLGRLGRHAEAADAMRAVVRLGGAEPGERYLVQPAIGRLVDAVAADPALRDSAFGRGLECLAGARLDCAVAAFAQAKDNAFLGLALLTRGELHLRAGNDLAAKVDLRDAAVLRPEHPDTRLLLGFAHHRAGEPGKARTEFAAFLRLDYPRGRYFREVIEKKRRTSALDAELLSALVEHFPENALAKRALSSLN